MPGTDPLAAVRAVLDELPDLPYLPELPARGPGADLIGRTAALLTELPVETTPGGWRLAARPGRDQRRARALLDQDLDMLEEAAAGLPGAAEDPGLRAADARRLARAAVQPGGRAGRPGGGRRPHPVAGRGHQGARGRRPQAGARRDPAAAVRRAAAARRAGRGHPHRQRPAPGRRRRARPGRRQPARGARGLRRLPRRALLRRPPAAAGSSARPARRRSTWTSACSGRQDEDPLAEAAEGGSGIFAGAVQPSDSERPEASQLARRVSRPVAPARPAERPAVRSRW